MAYDPTAGTPWRKNTATVGCCHPIARCPAARANAPALIVLTVCPCLTSARSRPRTPHVQRVSARFGWLRTRPTDSGMCRPSTSILVFGSSPRKAHPKHPPQQQPGLTAQFFTQAHTHTSTHTHTQIPSAWLVLVSFGGYSLNMLHRAPSATKLVQP